MDVVAATFAIRNYSFNYKIFRILIIMNRVLAVGMLVSYHKFVLSFSKLGVPY